MYRYEVALYDPRKLVPSRTSKWKPCCMLELRLAVNLLFKKCCVMGGEVNGPRSGQTEKEESELDRSCPQGKQTV